VGNSKVAVFCSMVQSSISFALKLHGPYVPTITSRF